MKHKPEKIVIAYVSYADEETGEDRWAWISPAFRYIPAQFMPSWDDRVGGGSKARALIALAREFQRWWDNDALPRFFYKGDEVIIKGLIERIHKSECNEAICGRSFALQILHQDLQTPTRIQDERALDPSIGERYVYCHDCQTGWTDKQGDEQIMEYINLGLCPQCDAEYFDGRSYHE